MKKTEYNEAAEILKNLYIGASTGAFECIITHPMWVMKTRRQCNYPFTLNPFVLYKGITYTMSSAVAITTLQIGSTITISEKINSNGPKDARLANLYGSIISGIVLGVITTPLDVTLVQQQKNADINSRKIQKDFLTTANKIKTQSGYKAFFYGAPAAAYQFALFNCGLFVVSPFIGKETKYYTENHTFSTLIGGSIAGAGLAFITQPLDTIGRLQQDEAIGSKARLTAFEHAKKLYNQNGFKGFFRGIAWRNAQVVVGTAIANTVIENHRPTF